MKKSPFVVVLALAFVGVSNVFGSLPSGFTATENSDKYTRKADESTGNRYKYAETVKTAAEIEKRKWLKELTDVSGKMIHPDTSDRVMEEANRHLQNDLQDPDLSPRALADSIAQVARLYKYKGYFEIAAPLVVKALKELKKDEPYDYYRGFELMDFQGEMACALGNFDEAERIYKEALELHRSTYGPASSVTRQDHLRDFHDLGLPILDSSLPSYHLDDAEFIPGERGENSFYGKHSDYKLNFSANLAEYYVSQTRVLEAHSVYTHAIKRIEDTLGEGHPDVAWTYDFLFLLYNYEGEFQKADVFLRKSIAIRRELLGDKRPFGFTTWDHKKLKKKVLGDYECVMKNYIAALEAREKRVPFRAISLRLLNYTIGQICTILGNDTEAFRYFKKADDILQRHNCPYIGDDIPMLLFLARHKESKKPKRGLYGKAEPVSLDYFKQLVKLVKEERPSDSKLLAEIYYEMAEVYRTAGDYVNSEKFHQNALTLRMSLDTKNEMSLDAKNELSLESKNELAVAQSLDALAKVHEVQKDYEKALSYYNRALTIKRTHMKDNDVSLASSYLAIGKLECGMNKGIKGWFQSSKIDLNKAEKLLKKAIEIYREQDLRHSEELKEAFDFLKQVYLSTGRNSEADTISREAKRVLER